MTQERAPRSYVDVTSVIAIDENNGALVGQCAERHGMGVAKEITAEAYDFTQVADDLEGFYEFLAQAFHESRTHGASSTAVALYGDISKMGRYDIASTPQWIRNTPHIRNAEGPFDLVSGLCARDVRIEELFRYPPNYRVVSYDTLAAHAAGAFDPNADIVAALDLGRTSITGGAVRQQVHSFRTVALGSSVRTILHPDWPQVPVDAAVDQSTEIDPQCLALASAKLGKITAAQLLVVSWDSTGQGLQLDEEAYRAALDELMASDDSLAKDVPEVRIVQKQGPTDPHILRGGASALLDSLLHPL